MNCTGLQSLRTHRCDGHSSDELRCNVFKSVSELWAVLLSITDVPVTTGKLVTEKPVDFVGFYNVVEFNKNRQNDDNVVKAYKS